MTTTAVQSAGFDARVAPLVSRMALVGGYRESLQRLQDVWDQLTLLGQMSGIAADITTTADEFRALTGTLLDSLAQSLLRNTLHRMQAQAQVAIDILVRNLFERTADVGFLATDSDVRDFLLGADGAPDASALQARFRAYVAKYSVYDDVVVLGTDGAVRARLDGSVAAQHCSHPLVAQALQADTPFVESFGAIDVLGGRRGLVYSAAIRDPRTRHVLGILCLSFRFDDEMGAIFEHLAPVGPCSVVVLCDAGGAVLASSDAWHLPVGAQLAPGRARDHRLFFGGREYLVAAVSATGYQGYAGPGWTACTLVPIDQAFRADDHASDAAAPAFPAGTLNNSSLVADELRSIPLQARRIQRGLERSVWNGEVRGRQRADSGTGFSAALLQQVTSTGARIRSVIENAIGDLQRSTAAAILDEARACSAFAIDIMDRNLYERANDCRWWALDGTLQQALDTPSAATHDAAATVLAHINSLYTVYASLLLLDPQGCVVAASNAAGRPWVGQTPDAGWVRPALQLRDGEAHVRSAFETSPLYGDRMTYVYAAGLRSTAGTGAVAIVFDGAPQFEAMLRDTLPKTPSGEPMPEATGLFVTRSGLTVSSTDPVAFPVGRAPAFQTELRTLARGESRHWVLTLDGTVYAAGASMSRGYREYNSSSAAHDDDVVCVVLIRVGARQADAADGSAVARMASPALAAGDARSRQLASFYCAGEWLALDAVGIVEAIDVAHLTLLPGSPSSVAGMVMHGNEAVTVIDLRSLRRAAPRDPADAPAPVILCKGHGRATFGLRVDELGQVLDIAPSSVKPLAGYLAQHDRHAEGVLSFNSATHKHMLTLLSVDGLASEFAARAA
jgi:chemotaxis signal transduction protein